MTNFLKFIISIFYKFFFDIKIIGNENIPKDKGYVILANHISQHDPLVIAVSLEKLIYALGKKELFSNFLFIKLFNAMNVIPVDRKNIDITAMKKSLRILKKKKSGLLIFPEGTRNFGEKPLKSTPGVSMLAIKAKVPIVPITIDSTYKIFSKINIKIHKPLDMSEYYKKKLETNEYRKINSEILNVIYNEMSLYKLRKCYEDNPS